MDSSNGSGNGTAAPITLQALTQKALKRLSEQLDSPDPLAPKDLKDIAFGLLDRTSGQLPGLLGASHEHYLVSSSARGAVLGALEGLAAIAKTSFNRSSVEERLVTPLGSHSGSARRAASGLFEDNKELSESEDYEQEAESEKNPYSGLQDTPWGERNGRRSGKGPVPKRELPAPGAAVHRKRVSKAGTAKADGKTRGEDP